MLKSDDYDKLPIEVYQEIYSEAKIKFEETKSRSEIITGRSLKIILFVSALSGWTASSTLSTLSQSGFIFMSIYVIILSYCLIKAVSLFFSRNIPLRGTMPRVIYHNSDDLINKSYNTLQVFYWQQIARYQKKIDEVEVENKRRGRVLTECMVSAFILFLYTIIIYVCKQNEIV